MMTLENIEREWTRVFLIRRAEIEHQQIVLSTNKERAWSNSRDKRLVNLRYVLPDGDE